MSDPNTIIRLHLTGEGMNLEELGWPDLREFLDLIVDAIGAQPGGPKPHQVLPLAVKAGSAEPRLRVPRSAIGAADRLRRSWNRNWTVEQRRSARPVSDDAGALHLLFATFPRRMFAGAPELITPDNGWGIWHGVAQPSGLSLRVGGVQRYAPCMEKTS